MTGIRQHARFHGPRLWQDPAAVYAELREQHGPVAPILLEGDIPAWFVGGYRELHQVFADAQLFARDTRRWNGWDRVPDDWPLLGYLVHSMSVLYTEGPEHTRRAGAISDALSAVDQFDVATQCERIADRLIDRFAGLGEAELVSEYADQIPLRAAALLCGMPDTDARALVADLTTSLDSPGADPMAPFERLRETMRQLVEAKRRDPGEDVASHLLADPAHLTGEEIMLDLLVILNAAHTQTANWIGNTIRLMLTDPRFATTLSGGRASTSDALNEVLWKDTPSPNHLCRIVTRDTRLGTQHLRAGDLLVLGIAAANNDPAVHQTEGTATNRAQMSFGHGEHGCPYPAPELAETIARTSVEVLLDRLPDLTLAVAPESLTWRPSAWSRGLVALPVTFTPAYVT